MVIINNDNCTCSIEVSLSIACAVFDMQPYRHICIKYLDIIYEYKLMKGVHNYYF